MNKLKIFLILACLFVMQQSGYGQQPYRVGTVSANFLEIGVGAAPIAMGDAYVAVANDFSSIYWNPAGMAFMESNEAMFMYQPWVGGINTMFTGIGLSLPRIGTLGFSVFGLSYGNIDVTSLDYQDGTGEQYTAYDYSFNLAYARRLANWFSFGASAKYISSKIWHSSASAFAVDLGVIVQTGFFSATDHTEDGLKIGMSISNYGTRMQFDGMDLLIPVDPAPHEAGNYQNSQGKYRMQDWELPLLFRVGIAVDPVVLEHHRITIALDATHPNNMNEYVNIGAQYKFDAPGFGDFFLRGGYKALFLQDSQFGPTFGGGIKFWAGPSRSVKIDYAFRTLGVLGNIHCTSLALEF